MRIARASSILRVVIPVAAILVSWTSPGVASAERPADVQPQRPADASGPSRPPGEPRGSRRGPPPFEDILERNADRLGLDERTRAEIRSIADATREKARGLEEGLHGLHAEMRGILDQATPDLDSALRQAERVGAMETELHKLRLESMLKIRALLTPQQREELVRIHEERRRTRGHEPLQPGAGAGGARLPDARGAVPPPPVEAAPPPGPPLDAR